MAAHTEGVTLEVESTLEQQIREGQLEDVDIREIRETMERGKAPDFTEDDQGTIWFKNRIRVIIPYYHLNQFIWSLSHNKESSR
jgi:hypothetical protein